MAGFLFHLIFSAIFFGATKNPADGLGFLRYKCLTMTYSRMGRPHTTIGAKRFHC